MTEVGQRQTPAARVSRAKREGGVSRQPGYAEPDGHVVVNADHIGPEALIDGNAGPCVSRTGARAGVTVIVGHERNLTISGGARLSFSDARLTRIIWPRGAPLQVPFLTELTLALLLFCN